ncbi:MAG TPA: hypothetical protein VMU57_00230, partial [Edaphobacter sp.]|uniref:hypothetical protein n=1 Tax=Edaphobacter sp. TaxID=1934404 RepID=UPI002CE206B7
MKFLAIFLLLSTSAFATPRRYRSPSPVHVRSTVTKRGVYRTAHVRTAPDRTQRNNYSTKGNMNPYTGKAGTRTA